MTELANPDSHKLAGFDVWVEKIIINGKILNFLC